MIKDKIASAWEKIKVWLNDHLVEEAREWWMLWSTRLNAIGVAILAWIQIDPVGVLEVWNMMPESIQSVVPSNIFQLVAITLFLLGMMARFVKQPKVEERNEARKQYL